MRSNQGMQGNTGKRRYSGTMVFGGRPSMQSQAGFQRRKQCWTLCTISFLVFFYAYKCQGRLIQTNRNHMSLLYGGNLQACNSLNIFGGAEGIGCCVHRCKQILQLKWYVKLDMRVMYNETDIPPCCDRQEHERYICLF